MTTSALSPSFFDRYLKAMDWVLDDIIRIDRPLEAFFFEPSIKTAIDLASKVIVPLTCISTACVLGTAFGVYCFVLNILLGAFFKLGLENFKIPSLGDFFSNENGPYKILLGLAAWFPIQFLERVLLAVIEKSFLLFGLPLGGGQDVGLLLSSGGINGLIWMFMTCIVAPASEEILFRGWLTNLLKEGDNPTAWSRFVTAVKTNAVFGALHLSPFQGWFNIPIFAVTFLMGMCFSFLKEWTGDLWAPATCHMANNMIATVALRCQ